MRAAHMNKAGMSARGSWVWCCEFIYGWQTLFHTRGVGEEESARPFGEGQDYADRQARTRKPEPTGGFNVGTRLRYIE